MRSYGGSMGAEIGDRVVVRRVGDAMLLCPRMCC